MSQHCVLCNERTASTREHVPAELFFDTPLPNDLITVPACEDCNRGSQKDDEYLRAYLMLLTSAPASTAVENVRQRVGRQLRRVQRGGLLARIQSASTLSWVEDADGILVPELMMQPEGDRLTKVMTKYVRGLHFAVHREPLEHDAVFSIERIFNRANRSEEYWAPLLDAAAWAESGVNVKIGTKGEFRYAYRSFPERPLIEIFVLEFYGMFPFVATVFASGTDFTEPMMLPFRGASV